MTIEVVPVGGVEAPRPAADLRRLSFRQFPCGAGRSRLEGSASQHSGDWRPALSSRGDVGHIDPMSRAEGQLASGGRPHSGNDRHGGDSRARNATAARQHEVLVLGAGYAGLSAAIQLAARTRKRGNPRVTLVKPLRHLHRAAPAAHDRHRPGDGPDEHPGAAGRHRRRLRPRLGHRRGRRSEDRPDRRRPGPALRHPGLRPGQHRGHCGHPRRGQPRPHPRQPGGRRPPRRTADPARRRDRRGRRQRPDRCRGRRGDRRAAPGAPGGAAGSAGARRGHAPEGQGIPGRGAHPARCAGAQRRRRGQGAAGQRSAP